MTAVLYAKSFTNGFVLDDHDLIAKNPSITHAGLDLLSAFTSEYWRGTGFNFGVYRPLTLDTFVLENAVAGIHPWSGHAVNIFLYALAAWFFSRVVSRIFERDPRRSFIVPLATLLFLFHPIHTEIVGYVKGRDDLLSLLGGLMSLHFLLRREHPRGSDVVLAALAYAAALFSKESSLVWLALVAVVLYFKNASWPRRSWAFAGASFGAVTLAYFGMRFATLKGFAPGDRDPVTFPLLLVQDSLDRWATTLWIGAKYFWMSFVPWPLLSDYSYNQIPPVEFWSAPGLLLNVALLAFLAIAARLFYKRANSGLGLAMFLAALTVPLAYSYFYGFSMAERMLAIPSIGCALLLADLVSRLPGKARLSLAAAMLSAFAFMTFERNWAWESDLSLLEADHRYAPDNSKVAFLLAREVRRKSIQEDEAGRGGSALLDRSILLLQRSLEIYQDVPDVLRELGAAYGQKGDLINARTVLEKSNSAKTDGQTLYLLGLIDFKEDRLDQAKFHLNESLRVHPKDRRVLELLAQVHRKSGDEARAAELEREASLVTE